ncbi:MAG: hypothetical protein IPP74_14495 [Alphaproteobacteria bacterium]|nr:hypothetical protein [Alphaproteobacteria bacterium]
MKKVAIGLLVGLAFLLPSASVYASVPSENERIISNLVRQIRMLQKQLDALQEEQKVEEVKAEPVKVEAPKVVPPKFQNGGNKVGTVSA